MSEFHGRYTEVVSAWEREIRQQNHVNKERAQTILNLESQIHKITLQRNEAQLALKKS
jgi:hypothetical protein